MAAPAAALSAGAVAAAGTAKYRHVEEWSDTLRKKVMWDHRVPKYNDTLVLGKKVKAADGSSVDDKRLTATLQKCIKSPQAASAAAAVEAAAAAAAAPF
jgi:hypothetical protein